MVLRKDDQEAVSAHITKLSAFRADPEAQGNREMTLRELYYSDVNKKKDNGCVAMSSIPQDQSNQPDSCNSDSIKRPVLTSAGDNELTRGQLIPCPVCAYPCWNCRTIEGPPQAPSPVSEDSSGSMDSSNSPPENSIRPRKKRKLHEGREYLGPKDEQFAEEILQQCGLEIGIGQTASVGSIFDGLQQPTESRVFIDLDDQRLHAIAMDICIFDIRRYDEDALAFLLSDFLLKRDHFIDPRGPKAITSLRRDKWKFHETGPQIPGREYYYDWNMEPDVTYMVSTNMFDPRQRRRIRRLGVSSSLFAEPNGICPYLTIEYKSTAKGGKSQDAMNQVAAASIVWLNSRRRIRARSGSTVYEDLRHYAFTFPSDQAIVWETLCTQDGYVLRELDNCHLTTSEGLKRFIQWSNAIHAWGLGPNASTFNEDVENYLVGEERKES